MFMSAYYAGDDLSPKFGSREKVLLNVKAYAFTNYKKEMHVTNIKGIYH
jgi:hypothetical protein